MKNQPPASIVALINSLPVRLRATAMQHAKWDAEDYYNQQLDVEVPVWDVELYDKRAWAAAEDNLRFCFFGH